MRIPTLTTERLLIREFTPADLDAAYHLLDVELSEAELGDSGPQSRSERALWLEWSVLNYGELAKLYQPPYGDRAIELKASGALIGACGLVPCLGPFRQLPALADGAPPQPDGIASTEVGLFYAISPAARRQGYASEAAQALLDYTFTVLKLRRVIATTTYDNSGSQAVMRRLGMQIHRNPRPTPPYLQIVGVITNPALTTVDVSKVAQSPTAGS